MHYFDPFSVLEKIGEVFLKYSFNGKVVARQRQLWRMLQKFKPVTPQFNLEDKVPFKGGGNVMNLSGNGKPKSAKEREKDKLVTNGPRNVGVRKGSRVRLANRLRDFV